MKLYVEKDGQIVDLSSYIGTVPVDGEKFSCGRVASRTPILERMATNGEKFEQRVLIREGNLSGYSKGEIEKIKDVNKTLFKVDLVEIEGTKMKVYPPRVSLFRFCRMPIDGKTPQEG